ncbi:hypothetical protein LWI28_008518 [Acer negundo]|uniref:FAS1 domain-containing protein n=1 Tax=Acer negundo TaxID=4023 RepID=A0AAD5NJ53_ACENE|nr:hypothetical protein LWI28_008518 [Acer negundo]KAK4838022.1 hypothetical protein QYF36_010420 [Acer negundo]
MSSSKHVSLFFSFFLLSSSASALNITDILSKYPEFSTFSNLLVQTKVGDAINSRQSITVLVVNNGAFSSLSGEPDNVVKNILSLHVILDYFDQQKLQKLDKKTALLTTLFQSSGQAKGQQGFLNVTNLSDGSIAFGPAVPGAELKSKFEKAVTSQPYNISILQVSSVIAPPGMAGNSNYNSNSTTEKQSSNSPSPASSPTKNPAPGSNPEKPPANNATSASPNPAKKESPANSPEKALTPSDAGKSPGKAPTPSNSKAPTPSKSKAPTPSTADSPDASSPTSAEEPAAAETPTFPMGSPPEPGSAPEPVAGDASGPAAGGQSAGSLAAPIDCLKMGALAVIFAWTWSLF